MVNFRAASAKAGARLGEPTKTVEQNFADWESTAFGFGYGSGEEHVLSALKRFFEAFGAHDRPCWCGAFGETRTPDPPGRNWPPGEFDAGASYTFEAKVDGHWYRWIGQRRTI